MAGRVLTAEDRAYFLGQMRRQLNSAVHRRMNVLLLLDDGWTQGRVASALYLDDGTVAAHLVLYETQGRAGIERLTYLGRSSALDGSQRAALSAWVEAEVPQTAQAVCQQAMADFGVSLTPHGMAKLLNRLGFVFKKPKCVPAKAEAAVQERFVDTTLKPLMDGAGPATPLYFVDACHPSYTGRPAHGWLRRGARTELKSNHGRTRLNINGALSWPDRTVIRRDEALITSAAMIRLFDDLEARHPGVARITIVLDNAKYNVSRELQAYLKQPDRRLNLLYLPSYAPNLNLIERFWHFMKRKVLFNKAYSTFSLFKQAFDAFFERLPTYAEDLKTLITDRFHYIGKPNLGIPKA